MLQQQQTTTTTTTTTTTKTTTTTTTTTNNKQQTTNNKQQKYFENCKKAMNRLNLHLQTLKAVKYQIDNQFDFEENKSNNLECCDAANMPAKTALLQRW